MKCERCGAELKQGYLYCSSCGKEVQIVPDYNVEEEYLSDILKKSAAESSNETKQQPPSGKKASGFPKKKKKKIKEAVPIIAVCCILVIGIAAGISYKMYVDYQNANSYDYQAAMAELAESEQHFDDALQYYKNALTLRPDDIAARLSMADIYVTQKSDDLAIDLYMEVLELDHASKTAYQKLIDIYERKKDYESIKKLSSDVMDVELLELFEDYLVAEPVFSEEAGVYEEYITLTLSSADGFDIFYTLDGTSPDGKNGILYEEGEEIELDEAGEYVIKAVCCNERGVYSDVEVAEYQIDVRPPEHARISPNGGRIEKETVVTITAEAGCGIYYTWDGTEPTTGSERYTQPLTIPTGNNILSVLVVNYKTKLDSGVYRANFIYYPKETDPDNGEQNDGDPSVTPS